MKTRAYRLQPDIVPFLPSIVFFLLLFLSFFTQINCLVTYLLYMHASNAISIHYAVSESVAVTQNLVSCLS